MPIDKDPSDMLGAMFKSMMDRDPKKRRVKPNQKNHALWNMDFIDPSSSEDEDYVPADTTAGNEEDLESDKDLEDEGQDVEDESEEESDEESDEESVEDEEDVKPRIKQEDDVQYTASSHLDTKITIKINQSPKKSNREVMQECLRNLTICSICLGDHSVEADEIVECDSCHITVHEACYGLINPNEEIESLSSNASSASTEPWFCDPCRSGLNAKNLVCELCPLSGGIFKQTETGRWVHLVCALYINGVAFANTINLNGITLFEMSYERWGAKTCSLCEDERLARTGVCISCDAGMCKNHFHVTCAQKQGLLCEPLIHDDLSQVVDPFFAHCKQHSVEKHVVKTKKKNYLALQSRLSLIHSEPHKMDQRILNKLAEMRQEYARDFQPKVTVHIGNNQTNALQNLQFKVPRALTSSASAMRKLIEKAEVMGLSSKGQIIHADDYIDVRKKWHLTPAFNMEFVSYFLDRENRMEDMENNLKSLKKQNSELLVLEEQTRQKYEMINLEKTAIKQEVKNAKSAGRSLYGFLSSIIGKPIPLDSAFVEEKEVEKKKGCLNGRVNGMGNFKVAQQLSQEILKQCGLCHKSTDQHTLALCDKCHLHYHFTCLDPPLSRMPRKTKFGGWVCSECTAKEEEDAEALAEKSFHNLMDTENGLKLRLRENVKCPDKYLPDNDFQAVYTTDSLKKKKKKRSLKRKQDAPIISSDELSLSGVLKRNRNFSTDSNKETGFNEPLRIVIKKEFNCCVCEKLDLERFLVKCDKCTLYYHFTCLDPPLRKTPKPRGYDWYCKECDSSGTSEEISDEEQPNKSNEGENLMVIA